MNILDLIEELKYRPGLYFSPNSVFCLKSFIDGMKYANPNIDGIELYEGFQEWIMKLYSINSSQSWASILRFYSSDAISATDLFHEKWNIYLTEIRLKN